MTTQFNLMELGAIVEACNTQMEFINRVERTVSGIRVSQGKAILANIMAKADAMIEEDNKRRAATDKKAAVPESANGEDKSVT